MFTQEELENIKYLDLLKILKTLSSEKTGRLKKVDVIAKILTLCKDENSNPNMSENETPDLLPKTPIRRETFDVPPTPSSIRRETYDVVPPHETAGFIPVPTFDENVIIKKVSTVFEVPEIIVTDTTQENIVTPEIENENNDSEKENAVRQKLPEISSTVTSILNQSQVSTTPRKQWKKRKTIDEQKVVAEEIKASLAVAQTSKITEPEPLNIFNGVTVTEFKGMTNLPDIVKAIEPRKRSAVERLSSLKTPNGKKSSKSTIFATKSNPIKDRKDNLKLITGDKKATPKYCRKIPNFAEIHKKNFEKMDDIVTCQKKNRERAEFLMSPVNTKIPKNHKTQIPVIKSRLELPKTPIFPQINRNSKINGNTVPKSNTTSQAKPLQEIQPKGRPTLMGVRKNRCFVLRMSKRI